MLDHVSLGVTGLPRSRRFYDAALRPLGLTRIVNFGNDRGSDYGAAPGSSASSSRLQLSVGQCPRKACTCAFAPAIARRCENFIACQ